MLKKSPLSQSQIEEIVPIISETISKKSPSDKIVVPPGFFVFQFRAQWGAGGYEDESVCHTLIIEASNLKEAMPKLKDYLSIIRENYSEHFMVYIDDEWKRLKTMLHGKPNSCISQMFDLHKTEFTLA